MLKKLMSLMCMSVICAGLIGCAAAPPRWAHDEEGVVRDEQDKAILGVGKATHVLGDEDVMVAAASVRARTNMRKESLDYASELVSLFFTSNEEWVDFDALDPLMETFKESFKRANRLTGKVVEQWKDEQGAVNDSGTLYVLARQQLDKPFFELIENTLVDAIDRHEDAIVADKETVLDELRLLIELASQNPFAVLDEYPHTDPVEEDIDEEEAVDEDLDEDVIDEENGEDNDEQDEE